MNGRRAVFLDRDGVLNRAEVRDGHPFPPVAPRDVEMLAGAGDACRRLAAGGWMLFVVTNQPDIARGIVTRGGVDAVNAAVIEGLPIADVAVCPHDDADACSCRKPLPGMLLELAHRWNLDLAESVMIGDRWRDVGAGARAGTRTIFVDHAYAEELRDVPDHVVGSLAEAAALLVDAARTALTPPPPTRSIEQ